MKRNAKSLHPRHHRPVSQQLQVTEAELQIHTPEELEAAGAELERMSSTDTTEGSEHR